MITSSRVTDGICDCCDGSDEYSLKLQLSPCPNVCREAAREARKGLRAQIAKYEAGLKAKEAFFTTFLQKIEQEKQRKLTVEQEKSSVQAKEKAQTSLKDSLQAKRDALAESVKAEITALVEAELAKAELQPVTQDVENKEPVVPEHPEDNPPPPPPPPPTPEEKEKEKQKLVSEKTNAVPEIAALQEGL